LFARWRGDQPHATDVGVPSTLRQGPRTWDAPRHLHFELLASTKLLTELTTVDAEPMTVAIWVAEGFAVSALTALVSPSTEDLMALVWVGKSPLASVTTLLASVLTFWN